MAVSLARSADPSAVPGRPTRRLRGARGVGVRPRLGAAEPAAQFPAADHPVREDRLLGLPPQQRGLATAAATAILCEKGIFWHRVHDVTAARQAMTVAMALRAC